MLNVIENHLECKFIDPYWLSNIIIDQEKNRKNRNKGTLNAKYEEKIVLDDIEFTEQVRNYNKTTTKKNKEQNYSESCRKYYTHKSYESKKDFQDNYKKRESLVKTDIYDRQSKPRIYEYTYKNKKSDILLQDRGGADILIKSFSRNNL